MDTTPMPENRICSRMAGQVVQDKGLRRVYRRPKGQFVYSPDPHHHAGQRQVILPEPTSRDRDPNPTSRLPPTGCLEGAG